MIKSSLREDLLIYSFQFRAVSSTLLILGLALHVLNDYFLLFKLTSSNALFFRDDIIKFLLCIIIKYQIGVQKTILYFLRFFQVPKINNQFDSLLCFPDFAALQRKGAIFLKVEVVEVAVLVSYFIVVCEL